MAVNFEQPVISGKQYGPTPGGNPPGGYTGTQARGLTSPGGTEAQGGSPNVDPTTDPSTVGLPIETDPAYMIFAANTGLQRDLSRIGVAQDIPEIQRQRDVGLSNLGTSERRTREATESSVEQRGLGSSGLAAQKFGDIAGQFGVARQNIIGGSQAQIDKAVASDQAVQRSQGASMAPEALNASQRVAVGSGGS